MLMVLVWVAVGIIQVIKCVMFKLKIVNMDAVQEEVVEDMITARFIGGGSSFL